MSGWTVILTNVWLSWCFYLSGSKSLRVYFYHNLLRAFGVMGEMTHHLCLSRVHIHVMTCINHEMLCIRHFVDLTLLLQSTSLCYHDDLHCRCVFSLRAFCTWTRFASVWFFFFFFQYYEHMHTHTYTCTVGLSSADADSSWLTQVDLFPYPAAAVSPWSTSFNALFYNTTLVCVMSQVSYSSIDKTAAQ